MSYKKDHFLATPTQFITTAVHCFVFAMIAVRLPLTLPARFYERVPSPWLTGLVTLITGSAVSGYVSFLEFCPHTRK